MRSDASLDDEIKTLEQRIRDRRLAFRQSIDELEEAAAAAKDRLRQKATSPVVWGGALVVGFLAARFAGRRHHELPEYRATLRVGKRQSTTRRAVAGLLSAALPIALRLAQRQAAPLIARAVQELQQRYARRRAYGRYGASY
jgi:hypothetical protein